MARDYPPPSIMELDFRQSSSDQSQSLISNPAPPGTEPHSWSLPLSCLGPIWTSFPRPCYCLREPGSCRTVMQCGIPLARACPLYPPPSPNPHTHQCFVESRGGGGVVHVTSVSGSRNNVSNTHRSPIKGDRTPTTHQPGHP